VYSASFNAAEGSTELAGSRRVFYILYTQELASSSTIVELLASSCIVCVVFRGSANSATRSLIDDFWPFWTPHMCLFETPIAGGFQSIKKALFWVDWLAIRRPGLVWQEQGDFGFSKSSTHRLNGIEKGHFWRENIEKRGIFGQKSCFSGQKSHFQAKNRIFRPKIVFFRPKIAFSGLFAVYPLLCP